MSVFNFSLYHSVQHPEVDYDHVEILLATDLFLVDYLSLFFFFFNSKVKYYWGSWLCAMALWADNLKTLYWLHGVIAFYYTQCLCVGISAYNLITSLYNWEVISWFDNTNLFKLIWAADSGTRCNKRTFPQFFPLNTTKHTWIYYFLNVVMKMKVKC